MRVLLFIFTLFLGGCITAKKVTNFLDDNKQVAADYCAETFPVKDSSYITDSVIVFDTLYVDNTQLLLDTIIVNGEPIVITKECPPQKIITKTVRRDSVIIRRDMAMETSLRSRVVELSNSNVLLLDEKLEYKEKAQTRGLYLWGLIIAISIWVLRKPILGIVRKMVLPI